MRVDSTSAVIQPLTLCQLTREYKAITENPPPYITAHPSESNILEFVFAFYSSECSTPRPKHLAN